LSCRNCGGVGMLNNHGKLKSETGEIRGIRLWCCPRRKERPGCGKSFCIYLASVIPRHSVGAVALAHLLWAWFELQGDVLGAWQQAKTGFSTDSAYRWVKRFVRNQGEIRSRLCRVRAPPRALSKWIHAELFEHLQLAFGKKTFTKDFQIHFQSPWPMHA
jgi:hypothetical protein